MPAVATQTRIRLKCVLFATDFSWAANAAIPCVNEIAEHFGSHVVAAHIRSPAVNPMTYPTSWPVYVEAAEAENKKHRSELNAQIPGDTEVIVEEGDVRTNLLPSAPLPVCKPPHLSNTPRSRSGAFFASCAT